MFPAGSYVTAQRVRRLIAEEFERAFERVDVIVTPVSIPRRRSRSVVAV
jgi:Asp-tRNA(Asn)/Glu-tRNA(Gln) amidotransferase A subunit family amidase